MSPVSKFDAYMGIARAINRGNFDDASALVTIVSDALSESIKKNVSDDDHFNLSNKQMKKFHQITSN